MSESSSLFPSTPIRSEEAPGIRSALTRYRVLAWIVGTLLIVLVCVGVPLKYTGVTDAITTYVGVGHGWLFMAMVICAIDLGRRVRWSLKWYAAICLAGLIPFLTFVAEHFATRDVRRRVAAVKHEPSKLASD